MISSSNSSIRFRFIGNRVYKIVYEDHEVQFYRRMDKWYHRFYKRYYFSVASSSKLYRFTKHNLKKVYKGTNSEFLITHYNRLNKTLILKDRELYQSPICRLMNHVVLNAQYYKIVLYMKRFQNQTQKFIT